MMKLGFTNVMVLKGGWKEWFTAGYPVMPKPERQKEETQGGFFHGQGAL
jgi:3-mercaptopyruvate sulfurtransferase SseA